MSLSLEKPLFLVSMLFAVGCSHNSEDPNSTNSKPFLVSDGAARYEIQNPDLSQYEVEVSSRKQVNGSYMVNFSETDQVWGYTFDRSGNSATSTIVPDVLDVILKGGPDFYVLDTEGAQPGDWFVDSCRAISFFINGETWAADECTYRTKNGVHAFIQTTANSESESENFPLSGLLSFTQTRNDEIVLKVDLLSWEATTKD